MRIELSRLLLYICPFNFSPRYICVSYISLRFISVPYLTQLFSFSHKYICLFYSLLDISVDLFYISLRYRILFDISCIKIYFSHTYTVCMCLLYFPLYFCILINVSFLPQFILKFCNCENPPTWFSLHLSPIVLYKQREYNLS